MAPPEKSLSSGKTEFARRDFLACMAGAGLSGTVFCDILRAKIEGSQSVKVTEEMLAEAEHLTQVRQLNNFAFFFDLRF